MQFADSSTGAARPRLNIWWFSQYASTPDQQFTTQYDLAKQLVEKGHQVTFFSAGFSHYQFKEIRLEPGEEWRTQIHQGVHFVWIRTPHYRANNWRRALNICAYAWRGYRIARRWQEAPDLVIGTTFHPLASLCGYEVSVQKKVPFIFEVKDLWPLTMIEFGRLSRQNPIAMILRALERFLARRATRIMTTLPGATNYYSQMGIPKEKLTWIPNGLDLARYKNLRPYSGVFSERCILLYAGGLVSANALETVLRSARILQEQGGMTHFIFIGGGQEKPKFRQMAKDFRLGNVEFRDAVPKTELHLVMEEADAFILSMRDLPGLYRYGMSFNKLCDYVACGRPVLFAGNPSHNVVEEFDCGIVVPPENPEALAEAISRFMKMTAERRAEMGRNGIRCAKERFDIAMLADRMEQMLLSVVGQWRHARHAQQEKRNHDLDEPSARGNRAPQVSFGKTGTLSGREPARPSLRN